MTVLFSSMLVRGGNGSFSNPSDVVDLQALPTVTATTQQQDDEAIFLWIPLIVVIIFGAIIATLIIIGRQTNDACKCLRVSPGLESGSDSCVINGHPNLHLNINVQINALGPTFPETPPPSYSAIIQQTSYISSISQTSSQIEIPPDYDNALGIADGNNVLCTKNRRFQPLSTRGSIFCQNQLLKSSSLSRIRLFSRSSSTSESPQRASLLRQSSTPAASESVLETVDVPILATSMNLTALDIILEATGVADDSRRNQNSENEDSVLHRRDRQL